MLNPPTKTAMAAIANITVTKKRKRNENDFFKIYLPCKKDIFYILTQIKAKINSNRNIWHLLLNKNAFLFE
jgi:hypothetical protein